MNTNEKGNIGLAKVIAKLVEMGYYCFLPFTDTTCVDLIVGNSAMEIKRIQVKYRKKNENGVIEVPLETVVNGKKIPIDRSKIDYYFVYCPDNDKIYFVELENIPNIRTFALRVDKIKNSQPNIRYACDYEHINF